MKPQQKYLSAQSMRVALEDRLNRMAKEKSADILRLRRHVAFDRLLARLFSGHTKDLIVKGGYALELWINNARTTKDIDISFKGNLGGVWTGERSSDPKALQDFLQNLVSIDTKYFFEFIIGNAVLDLENAPYGGYRFPIESRMAGRVFIKFEVDVAAGDTWLEPHERVKTQDWFGFAGIEAPMIPVISQEQQFAEKVHAYTLPRKTPNSRVKDLVDILLLIENGKLKTAKVNNALSKTFKRRNTHPIPLDLPEPPESWKTPFRKMAETCGIPDDIGFAIDKIRQFYKTFPEKSGEETIPG
jgi:predicted nucleotidyltransferase component of viral defense system